jgi:glycosyltransferase involved in cell wall biosynthesis
VLRILVHDYGGYPFILQLADELAGRGHVVFNVVADGFRTPRIATDAGERDAATVVRLRLDEPIVRSGYGRVRQERRYGRLLAAEIARLRPEIVLSANTPLEAQAIALRATHKADGAFVFWLQDLHSVAITNLIGRTNRLAGWILGGRFERIERSLIRQADATVAISDAFVPVLEAWRVPDERIEVIENWAPVPPAVDRGKATRWATDHGLGGRPLVLYAGTLARKHNPELLIGLARGLPDANVVVAAEGSGADWLTKQQSDQANLLVLPLEPSTAVDDMLAAADLLVAILEPDAATFSAPSKVLTYLAAGRPILAAMPASNTAARTIAQTRAGRIVDPQDIGQLVAAARELLSDPEEMARAASAGRAYAEGAFEIGPIADRFEAVATRAIARKSHLNELVGIDTGGVIDAPREVDG